MAKLLRTPQARGSLKEIGRYTAEQTGSRETALRFLDSILTQKKTRKLFCPRD